MVESILRQPLECVENALADGDLDGHICALILRARHAPSRLPGLSTWDQRMDALLASPLASAPPRNARETALLGVRLALGQAKENAADFAAFARREIARHPMPPAACLRDEERFLVGIAAGTGVAASGPAAELAELLHERRSHVSIRQLCVDLWAEALSRGSTTFDQAAAKNAFALLSAPHVGRPSLANEDRVAIFWLTSRFLDTPWTPDDRELQALQALVHEARQAVATMLLSGQPMTPIDSAFVVDAWTSSPAPRLERRSALNDVLAVIETFPAAASVLKDRKRGRPAFVIDDEHDVQDLFHAVVLPSVPDLVEEDPAPKIAGKSSRLDFTSRATKLGLELKHLKGPGDLERVRREVLLDEATYQAHPYIETVVVFIHDPDRHLRLADRPAFEADLSQAVSVGGRTVSYVVRVR